MATDSCSCNCQCLRLHIINKKLLWKKAQTFKPNGKEMVSKVMHGPPNINRIEDSLTLAEMRERALNLTYLKTWVDDSVDHPSFWWSLNNSVLEKVNEPDVTGLQE
ncbi:unnamed protein product [Sphenostylis stenocarpa]|uniref:Uncharacterized protein n=1 Tax=Sphenostylis stenocarpa TaxID=92480 RepID=A0AA86W2L7_9FABA|nr:unnamed protein product [Sphenostylis stenocarpa]